MLLDRLAASLDALGTGAVDLPERQRTLRATLEWSVGLRVRTPALESTDLMLRARCMPDQTVKPGEPTVNPGWPGTTAHVGRPVTAESATIS